MDFIKNKIQNLRKKEIPQSIKIINIIIGSLTSPNDSEYDTIVYSIIQNFKKIEEEIKKETLNKYNINLHSFFNSLFTAANKQKNDNKHVNTFYLYMHLVRLFPFAKELLQTKYNQNNQLLIQALSCNITAEEKHTIYNLYTNNLTQLSMFDENELFEMYKFYYFHFFIGNEPFSINDFSKYNTLIDLFISSFTQSNPIDSISTKQFKNINILLIIEAFIDAYLSYLFKYYFDCFDNTNKTINEIKELPYLDDLLKIINNNVMVTNINSIVLQKLVILLCLFYSHFSSIPGCLVTKYLGELISNISPLFCGEIMLGIIDNYDNIILSFKENQIDSIFFDQYLIEPSDNLYKNCLNNENIYNILVKDSYKTIILNSCLHLIGEALNNNKPINFSFMQYEECLYNLLDLHTVNEEIIYLLYVIVKKEANLLTVDEWENILQMLLKIMQCCSHEGKKTIYYDEFIEIIELLVKHNKNEKKLSSSFIDKLFILFQSRILKRRINQKTSDFFIRITFNTTNENLQKYLEPCIVQYLINDNQDSIINEKNPYAICEKNNVFVSLQHCYEMTINDNKRNIIDDIINDENKRNIIETIMLKYYHDIIDNCIQLINITKDNILIFISTYFTQILPSVLTTILINTNNIYFFKTILHNIVFKDVSSLFTKGEEQYLQFQKEIILKIIGILNERRTSFKLKIVIESIFTKDILENENCQLSPLIIEVMLHLVIKQDNIIIIENTQAQENQINPCLKKMINKEDKDNDNYIWIDINSIIKKSITMLNNNININQTSNSIEKERETLLQLLERASGNVNMLSKENLSSIIELVLQYSEKYKHNNNINLAYCFSIIKNCNFLLNYDDTAYFGDVKNQKNNIFNIENGEAFKLGMFNLLVKFYQCIFKIVFEIQKEEPKKSKNKEENKEKEQKQLIIKMTETYIPQLQKYINIILFFLFSSIDNSFFLNSTKMDYTHKSKFISETINTIIDYILKMTVKKQFSTSNWIIYIMSLLFNMRNIIRFTDEKTIMKCIFICFYFNRNQQNMDKLKQLGTVLSLNIPYNDIDEIKNDSKIHQHYFYHLYDYTLLSYLSFLEKDSIPNKYDDTYQNSKQNSNPNAFLIQNLLKDFISEPEERKSTIFLDLAFYTLSVNNITRDNLTNEDKEMLIKELDSYEIIKGKNEIVCVKELEYSRCVFYILSPISNIKCTISFDNNIIQERNEEREKGLLLSLFSEGEIKEEENIFLKEKKIEKKTIITPLIHNFLSRTYNIQTINITERRRPSNEQVKKNVYQLLTVPAYLTYSVNVLMYKPLKKEIDDFIYFVDSYEISSQFIQFISVLGEIQQNLSNEYIPIYTDYIYNINFNLLNTNKSKDEKKELFRNNSVNIIWVDSPISSFEKITSLFNSFNSSIQYSLIIVYPETDTHYHIKVRFSQENQKKFPLVEAAFLNDYIININSKSGIQYFINNLIALCEWDRLNCNSIWNINETIENNFIHRMNLIKGL